MQIKEVQDRTGLSSKAIRFYEEKGLILVQRTESDYREYTETDVEELLRIKLLRKCGLSIQQLIDLKNNKYNLEDILYEEIEKIKKEELYSNDRKKLCVDVIKANGNYSELNETVKAMDSDEYNQFVDEVIEYSHPSLARQIFFTIVGSGPMLSSFMFLALKQYDRLFIGFSLSIVMTVLLTLSWRSFIKDYKFEKETLKLGLKNFGVMFLLFVGCLFIMIGPMICINLLQISLFMKSDVYILSYSRMYSLIFLIMAFELCLVFLGVISKYLKHKDYKDYQWIYGILKKYKYIILLVNIIVGMFAFMHVTTISPQAITKYSLFSITGKEYQYNDIQQVECGFYKNGFLNIYSKGDFYYKVTMKDGEVISLEDCTPSKQYEKLTYSEMVAFDKEVMKYEPKKISSEDNFEYAMIDQIYIDQFISIINNK
ncbi:MAG: MerR family transcriptional regulator [Coprobacillus sp.]